MSILPLKMGILSCYLFCHIFHFIKIFYLGFNQSIKLFSDMTYSLVTGLQKHINMHKIKQILRIYRTFTLCLNKAILPHFGDFQSLVCSTCKMCQLLCCSEQVSPLGGKYLPLKEHVALGCLVLMQVNILSHTGSQQGHSTCVQCHNKGDSPHNGNSNLTEVLCVQTEVSGVPAARYSCQFLQTLHWEPPSSL